MLRDFTDYLRALWREWKALLTGGSTIAILALWQMVTGRTVQRKMNWLVIGLTLMVASFFAWWKEWILGGHGLVDLTPKQLVSLVRNKTKIHATIYTKQYLGKRIRITGKLFNVSTELFFLVFVSLQAEDMLIHLRMGRWKLGPYAPLATGTIITVAGRIREIDSYGLSVSNCEFIGVETDPMPTVIQPTSTPDS